MKISYKDFLILLLVITQIFLIFHIVFKIENNHLYNSYSTNNLSDTKEDVRKHDMLNVGRNNNTNNSSEKPNSNILNITRANNLHFTEDLNSSVLYHTRKNDSTVKNISLSKFFMDLPYSNTIRISEEGKEGIIKTYTEDGRIINFDVRNYKPNLDNPRYVKVSKEIRSFKYGVYYKYTFTVQYNNITSVSYCYYRRVGKYYIIMEFNKEDEFVKDMWLRWNEYIENLLYQ